MAKLKMLKTLLIALSLLTCSAYAGEKRYVVTLPQGDATSVAARHGLKVVRTLRDGNVLVTAPDYLAERDVLDELRHDPSIQDVESDPDAALAESPASASATQLFWPDLAVAIADRSVAPFFGTQVRNGYVSQPSASLIHLSDSYKAGTTGAGTVAIIDTGVDPLHPALRGVLVPGYDFVNGIPDVASDYADLSPAVAAALAQSTVAFLDKKDQPIVLNQSTVAFLDQSTVAFLDGGLPSDFGHGTMVAGLVHLVAPTANIMPLKAFKADGSAHLSDIVAAIYYAVDHGAKVINMSFSMADPSAELEKAIQYATAREVVCVASAGNQGRKVKVYPAGFNRVLSVASTDLFDKRSAFSNFGESNVATAAPGEALITTFPGNNYAAVWGTSFSAALVSGTAAIMQQLQPGIGIKSVNAALEKGHHVSEDLGESRLDVAASANSLRVRPTAGLR